MNERKYNETIEDFQPWLVNIFGAIKNIIKQSMYKDDEAFSTKLVVSDQFNLLHESDESSLNCKAKKSTINF